MIDYLPILIGFISALVGIFGKSWDDQKQGIKRITTKGWITISLAIVSFGVAGWTLHSKKEQLRDRQEQLTSVSNRQIIEGVNYLVRNLINSGSNEEVFKSLKDTTFLIEKGNHPIINPDSVGAVMNGITGSYIHPFELFAGNIKYGENLLNDALIKYGGTLNSEVIVKINDILNDKYFKESYSLRTQKDYFEIAIFEYKQNYQNNVIPAYTPYSKLGLYYFNRVYEGNGKRSGDFSDFLNLISKIESLTNEINKKDKTQIFE